MTLNEKIEMVLTDKCFASENDLIYEFALKLTYAKHALEVIGRTCFCDVTEKYIETTLEILDSDLEKKWSA